MEGGDVLVIGAGALGTLIGYAVVKSLDSLDILVRDVSKVENILERGCRASISGDEYIYRPRPVTWDTLDKRYNIIFICTKAYDIPKFIDKLSKAIDESTILVSIQNGIGSLELLKSRYQYNDIYGAVISYGAVKRGTCDTILTGYGEIVIEKGGYSSIIRDILEPTLKVSIVDDIYSYRWLKTLVNAGINPVTVIFNDRNGVVIENRYAWEIASKAVEEGLKVVNALGITLPRDPLNELYDIAYRTRDNYSSMYQDVLRGCETEIDYINGAIVEYGEKYNIDTPVNKYLVLTVKGLSIWRR